MTELIDYETTVTQPGFWDGQNHSYIPPEVLEIPAGLVLDSDSVVVDDPITFEVIRHSLWNINQEHASIIENLSVSPITLETRDFQTALLTEDGQVLFFGLGVQYFAGWMDWVIKYVMQHHGAEIHDGDMWLVNDPWVGTAHQPDVNLLCPVFNEGRLFSWVVNSCHQNDVGGTVPGSFCPDAKDIFFDPPCFPPIRIVRDGEIDSQLESIYRRQSRTPINLALDLRAAVAGNHASRERVLGLIAKYGAPVVKGVMNGLLDANEDSFKAILAKLPDGVWSERLYQEVAVTGDRGVYPTTLQMRKQGDQLTFTNEGTHPQVGAINMTAAAWRGTILHALNLVVIPDQMGCVGGAARRMSFHPTPGTMSCADWGAAVSPAGLFTTLIGVSMAATVFSRMLLSSQDPQLRSQALTAPNSQWQQHIHAGTNQRGSYYIGPMLDGMLGQTGPTHRADGIFANGSFFAGDARGPNVEAYERDWPMLYLYRRQDRDSGGGGRFRGSNGGREAYIPYKGSDLALAVYSAEGVPKTSGLLGGLPGIVGQTKVLSGTDTRAAFARGELPVDISLLGGAAVPIEGKGPALPIGDGYAFEWNWSGSGGHGDPLTRDPSRVAADVADDSVSGLAAHDTYAVVLDDAGGVDGTATAALRRERRVGRLRLAGLETEPRDQTGSVPDGAQTIGDDYWLDAGTRQYRCAHCGEATGSFDEHPKAGLAAADRRISDISANFADETAFVDQQMIWREFYCRGCGAMLANEVAVPGDDPLVEIRLEL
jgi:N-methylhydantoinase B